jgi:hypothetical protein
VNLQYSVFGLTLHSNIPIPELQPITSFLQEPDVSIFWQLSPSTSGRAVDSRDEVNYVSAYTDASGAPALKIFRNSADGLVRLEYSDGSQFWIDAGASNVWCVWPETLTLDDAATYLLGPVLGLLLRLRGVTCLHASAVAIGDHAVAFIGSEGAGKSTTAAALAQRGFTVISDDVVALAEKGGQFFVHPAYPYVCLWPESVASLYGSPDALPKFSANYEKRCLSLDKQQLAFATESLPLAAIFVLGDRRTDPAPVIELVSPQAALVNLIANTYATNMLNSAMRAREFETLGRLVPRLAIRKISAHIDSARIGGLCERIIDEMRFIVRNSANKGPAGP